MFYKIINKTIEQKKKALLVLFYYDYSWVSGSRNVIPKNMRDSLFNDHLTLHVNIREKTIFQSSDSILSDPLNDFNFEDFIKKETQLLKH